MKKRLLIGGALIVLLGIAVFLIYRSGNKTEEGILALSGNVEITEAHIGFKASGRVVELLVEEGQKVKKGDRLALLDSAELESQMLQSRAALHESAAKLQELRAGSRPQEIAQAGASVSSAEAELSKAKKDYERDEFLYTNGAVSAQQLDASKRIYETSVAQHRKTLESLSLIREGPRKEDIRAAGSRVKQAEAAVRVAEERLNDTVIYAPLSGVIIRKNIELGETVSPGMPVYSIGDLESPWIKVYVQENKLGLVKLGQKAEVTTDSYPGKKYEGRITFISSEAEFTPKNVQTQEERVKLVFGVKVSIKNEHNELKPGMPADARIVLR